MKTFFAMIAGFLLFLATSLVLAHSHVNTERPVSADNSLIFAADFVSGKERPNAWLTDGTTVFSVIVEPMHPQIVPTVMNAAGDEQTVELHKLMD